MGRRPKPATIHMREGTYQPSRHKTSPIAGGGIAKPANLGRYGSRLWDTVIDFVYQAGGGECDTEALTGMCHWYNDYRRLQMRLKKLRPGNKEFNKLIYTTATAWRQFMDVASRFGLTPADRAKLKSDVTETKDSLDSMFANRGA